MPPKKTHALEFNGGPAPESAAKPRKPAAKAHDAASDAIGSDHLARSLDDVDLQRRVFERIRLERARIPRRFINKSLSSFKAIDPKRRDLVKMARSYIDGFRVGDLNDGRAALKDLDALSEYKGLLLLGPVGCGKSHLAAGILREIVLKGYSGLFYNSPDLLSEIRATFQQGSEISEDDLIEEISSVDLLVLDDLGAEKVTDFVLDRFYLIINKRYESCLPLIVTTNCDMETLRGRLNNRVVSRLMEMCPPLGAFPDEDYRMKAVDSGLL